jgi:hypothetical protein
MVSKEIPKESKITWEDAMTIIVSEELYPDYLALPKDEFIKRFNKMLYDHIDVNLKEAKDKNVPDEDNIWMQPNAAFVKWFHEKAGGIDIDSIPSFLKEDIDVEYFKKKECTDAQINYIRLYVLTKNYIDENPDLSIRSAVIIVYQNNKSTLGEWSENSLNRLYHEGVKLYINK